MFQRKHLRFEIVLPRSRIAQEQESEKASCLCHRPVSQLRLGLSALKKHKFDYNFRDTHDPICACGYGVEGNEHFLLHCHEFTAYRTTLLRAVNDCLEDSDITFDQLSDSLKVSLLLYGDSQLRYEQNQSILVATLCYLKDSQRFD